MSKKVKLFVSLLLMCGFANAQNSILSSIGIGKIQSKASVNQKSLGGAGLALGNPLYSNQSNPSLLPNVKQFIAEVGVIGQYQMVTVDTKSKKNLSGDLDYFALTFPFSKKKIQWTGQIGVRPYSRIESQSKTNKPIKGTSFTANYNIQKTGGLNSMYFANGVNVYKGLHLGLNINYLFGTINNEQETTLFLGGKNTSVSTLNRYTTTDFTFSPSISYQHLLKKNKRVTASFAHDIGKSLKTKQFRSIERRRNTGLAYSIDTTSSKVLGEIHLPSKTTIGVAYEDFRKWAVAADITFQDWSSYSIFGENPNLKPTYGMAIGGEYTPDYKSIKRGFKRMTYRAGMHYNLLPFEINEKQYTDFGINFGTSMPIGVNQFSTTILHLGFGVGQRGDINTIKEQYSTFSIGISLNDFLWFRQPKIN